MPTTTPSKSIPRAIGISILLLSLSAVAYILLVTIPTQAARNTAASGEQLLNSIYSFGKKICTDIDSALHIRPQITSNGETIIQSNQAIAELATTESTFHHSYSYTSTWLGSTKKITLSGQFKAKAGFNLQKPLQINLSPDASTATISYQPAKILSVEAIAFDTETAENGWWNNIQPEELTLARNALLKSAKNSLKDSPILQQADSSLKLQLETIIQNASPHPTTIHFTPLP